MNRETAAKQAADATARAERQLADALLTLLDRQEGVVLARLTGTKARKNTRHWNPPGERKVDPGYVVDLTRWIGEAVDTVRATVNRIAVDAYASTLERLQDSAPPAPPLPPETPPPPPPEDYTGEAVATAVGLYMSAALAAEAAAGVGLPDVPDVPVPGGFGESLEAAVTVGAAALVGIVQRRLDHIARGVQKTSEQVQATISEGEAAEKPMVEIEKDVRDLYAEQKEQWAENLAQQNAAALLNAAAFAGAREAGAKVKQWLSERDDRVRQTHEDADGQVQALDDPFFVGVSLMQYPGDPAGPPGEVINCRCSLLFSMRATVDDGADLDPLEMILGKMLDEGMERKAKPRRVRTAGGARIYGQAIGSVIELDREQRRTHFEGDVLVRYAADGTEIRHGPSVRHPKVAASPTEPDDAQWARDGFDSPAEHEAHKVSYALDDVYRGEFDKWYSLSKGTKYAPPKEVVAKYHSKTGSSLWVYADGSGSARFAKGAKVEFTPDEVKGTLGKGAWKPGAAGPQKSSGHKPKMAGGALGKPAAGPPLVPITQAPGMPEGIRWTDERSPGGPPMTLDAKRLANAFGLVGIELTPGMVVNVRLRDQATPGEQGVTWKSGPNTHEVVVKVTPGQWPEPQASLYVLNNSLLHELRHVRQSQIIGSGFSADYAHENATVGYGKNKYEQEARIYGHLADPTGKKDTADLGPAPGQAAWVLGIGAS